MTLSELKKMIEDEVSALAPAPVQADSNTIREPQKIKKKAPYRTALQTEDEIDDALFYGGKRPQDD